MKEGWICPNCGRVWAPWMMCCDCTKGYVDILTTGTPNQPQRPTTGDPIPPDHYNTCGSVESATKAPDENLACKRCGGSGYVENTVNQLSDEMTCPDCNDIPVDDSLAKARDMHNKMCVHQGYGYSIDVVSDIVANYESAIRERDEKLSQSMTVEEFKEWHGEWYESNSQQALTESLYEMIVRKIKERNETRHPFDPGREVGGTD